jgi:hypothetical protein
VRRFLALLLLALAGCGGAPAAQLSTPPLAVQGDAATLTVQRTTRVWGMALVYEVDFDGKPVANLGPGRSATFQAPTGTHTLGLLCGGGPFGASSQITVNIEPGHSYRVEAFQTMNSGCVLRQAA